MLEKIWKVHTLCTYKPIKSLILMIYWKDFFFMINIVLHNCWYFDDTMYKIERICKEKVQDHLMWHCLADIFTWRDIINKNKSIKINVNLYLRSVCFLAFETKFFQFNCHLKISLVQFFFIGINRSGARAFCFWLNS